MRIKKKNEHIIKCHYFLKIIKILRDKILKSKKVEKNQKNFKKSLTELIGNGILNGHSGKRECRNKNIPKKNKKKSKKSLTMKE